uniref:L-like SALMFamide n=1 Tax=Stichopus japonicus TaxID=307972 RepID=A0A2Z4C9R5_STIJA|nr:L-like SALMFamide precursor [Apostichopus japonicus]
MKAYQIIVPAVMCVLAAILARTEADGELRILNNRLFELTKELEERLREQQLEDADLILTEDGDQEIGMKKVVSRAWSPLVGQTGIAFGKRTDGLDRARTQTDQRAKKTRSRSMFGNTALPFGKRAGYINHAQEIWDLQDAANNLDTFEEVPVKKRMGFTGNTGILLGKRNADDTQE